MNKMVINTWQEHLATKIQSFEKVEDIGHEYEKWIALNPTLRASLGAFYTPLEIVNYMVENTLGVYLVGKQPNEITDLKILDPACGGGFFLVSAYKFLLNWYVQFSSEKELTTENKIAILKRHIFGIDIDKQAIEITILSLSITALPANTSIVIDLSENIICENTLLLADDSLGFFDIIIGNPPYGANFLEGQKQYIKEYYITSCIEIESYLLFIEKTQKLLKNDGYCSLVVPSNLLTNIRYEKTRVFLLKNTSIEKLLDLGSNVFKQASVDTCIFITHKKNKTNHNVKAYIGGLSLEKNAKLIFDYQEFSQEQFSKNSHSIFNIYSSQKANDIADKIQKFGEPLGTIVKIARGVEFGYTSDYIVKNKRKKNAKPIVAGRCINRYDLIFEEKYVLYDEKDIKNFKEKIIYESDKILLRRIGHNIIAIFDNQQYYNVCDVYNLLARNGTNLKYLLALLNSKLMSFYLNTKFKNSKKLFPKISIAYLEQLPIRKIDNTNADEQKKMNDAILLVDKIMELHKILQTKLIPKDKDMYERMIKGLDNQIDTIVYELYELTPEEIDLIENYE